MNVPRQTADRAVRAGLEALRLYDRAGTLRLGHDVADCPVCGQMMRVDGWRFRCYAQCDPAAVADRLAADRRFVATVRSSA